MGHHYPVHYWLAYGSTEQQIIQTTEESVIGWSLRRKTRGRGQVIILGLVCSTQEEVEDGKEALQISYYY